MFADPVQILADNGVVDLPRVGMTPGLGTYRSSNDKYLMNIRQSDNGKRRRHEIRLTTSKIASDPLNASNAEVSTSVYLVVDEPKYGFTDTELVALLNALDGFTSDAGVRAKLLNGES